MPTRPIKITHSNATTGFLKLDDHEHTRADAGDTILWQIANKSGVHSIVSIQEKSDSANFWAAQPGPQGANWKGTISREAPVGAEYVYSIHWKASEDGPELIHDPKISIKPSPPPPDNIFRLITILLCAFVGIFTLQLFLSKKNEK